MRALIVDDDAELRDLIAQRLREVGHVVSVSASGVDGTQGVMNGDFDVLVIDRMLRDLDGPSLIKALRQRGVETPILVLTTLSAAGKHEGCLEDGAVEHLHKPFAFSELIARLEAIVHRTAAGADDAPRLLRVGDIVLDPDRRVVDRRGARSLLEPGDVALLAEFMRNPGRTMTRTMLLERVWGFDFDPRTDLVEAHVSRLASKLKAISGRDAIAMVVGGYVLREERG